MIFDHEFIDPVDRERHQTIQLLRKDIQHLRKEILNNYSTWGLIQVRKSKKRFDELVKQLKHEERWLRKDD